jgi:hypothetical protein
MVLVKLLELLSIIFKTHIDEVNRDDLGSPAVSTHSSSFMIIKTR